MFSSKRIKISEPLSVVRVHYLVTWLEQLTRDEHGLGDVLVVEGRGSEADAVLLVHIGRREHTLLLNHFATWNYQNSS